MYTTVRRYTANPGLAGKFASRGDEIKKVIQGVPGLIAYYLVGTADGAIAITVCDDKSGAEKSNQIAADWIKANMPTIVTKPPEVYAGDVQLHTTAKAGATR